MNASFLSRMRRSADDLDPAAAAAGAAEGRLLLIDVREPDEFRQLRAPGAQPVPLGRLAAELRRLGVAGRPVAFVCRSGSRSAMATRQARRAGVDAHNVTGGMLAWERQGLPVETGDPARPRRIGRSSSRPDPQTAWRGPGPTRSTTPSRSEKYG